MAKLSKFTVLFLSSYFVIYFSRLNLIFFFNRAIYYYLRIFLILILHHVIVLQIISIQMGYFKPSHSFRNY